MKSGTYKESFKCRAYGHLPSRLCLILFTIHFSLLTAFSQESRIEQGQDADDQGKGGEDQHDPPSFHTDCFFIKGILDLQESAEEQREAPDKGEEILKIIGIERQKGTGNQKDQPCGQAGLRNPPEDAGTYICNDGPDAAKNHHSGKNICCNAQGKVPEQDQQYAADKAENDRQDHGTRGERIRVFFAAAEELQAFHGRVSSVFCNKLYFHGKGRKSCLKTLRAGLAGIALCCSEIVFSFTSKPLGRKIPDR